MKLSAPIYHLKRRAKRLSRDENIPLHEALDRVAVEEGYVGWSLLAARHATAEPNRLGPGDLVLIGARPGQGKTLKSLELAVEAMKAGHRAYFFTLEYTVKDVIDRFPAIGADYAAFAERFEIDCSDAISASYITQKLAQAPRGTLVVVDYLQLLDQRRENPNLGEQVLSLRSFARERGVIMVFISQIDRSYDADTKPFPDIQDIRLPNPLDLRLFDKTCFLNRGGALFQSVP
ncbi:DNA helicase [Ensifer adhaerens]|uniref:DNA helicase n=1 Tax=Ensifer adhaerens TaxID=106592 RepID=UPI0023AA0572|nr:DNA helicase [Ensifer adhaerens]WDZ77137.1 DNA helicase [Ensifer adhaerens]